MALSSAEEALGAAEDALGAAEEASIAAEEDVVAAETALAAAMESGDEEAIATAEETLENTVLEQENAKLEQEIAKQEQQRALIVAEEAVVAAETTLAAALESGDKEAIAAAEQSLKGATQEQEQEHAHVEGENAEVQIELSLDHQMTNWKKSSARSNRDKMLVGVGVGVEMVEQGGCLWEVEVEDEEVLSWKNDETPDEQQKIKQEQVTTWATTQRRNWSNNGDLQLLDADVDDDTSMPAQASTEPKEYKAATEMALEWFSLALFIKTWHAQYKSDGESNLKAAMGPYILYHTPNALAWRLAYKSRKLRIKAEEERERLKEDDEYDDGGGLHLAEPDLELEEQRTQPTIAQRRLAKETMLWNPDSLNTALKTRRSEPVGKSSGWFSSGGAVSGGAINKTEHEDEIPDDLNDLMCALHQTGTGRVVDQWTMDV